MPVLPQTSELTDELDRLGFEEAFDPEAYDKLVNKNLRPLDAGSLGLSQRVPTQPLNAEQQAAAEYARRMGAAGGGMTPEQERAAREEEQRIVSGGTVGATVPAPKGGGVVAIPENPEVVLFPEEQYNKQFMAASKKRDDALLKSKIALADPYYRSRPEGVRKADEDLLKTFIDQRFPAMQPFEKQYPQVAKLGEAIQENISKRYKHLSDLRGIVDFIKNGRKEGESELEWNRRASGILQSQLKIYNTALVGTSDALSNEERTKIAPQLNESIFSPSALFRSGGGGITNLGKMFESNLLNFKGQVQILHDIILNEINDGYNMVAVQSSPEFANRLVGFPQSSSYGQIPFTPRVGRDTPKEVIQGTKTVSEAFFEKQARFNAKADEYYRTMDRLIQEGKASPDAAREVVSKAFLKETGLPLPPKSKAAKK